MYELILCEGKTDAIALSYYVIHEAQYQFLRKNKQPVPTLSNINENLLWYQNNSDINLAICSIEGNDFTAAIEKVMQYNKDNSVEDSFKRIVAVMDHDDDKIQEKIEQIGRICNSASDASIPMLAGKWYPYTYENSFNYTVNFEIACILQPDKEYGALETFVLQMLTNGDAEKESVAKQSKHFVQNFSSATYLQHRRDKTKAELSVAISVMWPDRTFETINEFLEKIEWGKFGGFHQQFALLNRLGTIIT